MHGITSRKSACFIDRVTSALVICNENIANDIINTIHSSVNVIVRTRIKGVYIVNMSKSKKETYGIIVGLIVVISVMALKFFAGNTIVGFVKGLF